MKRKFRIQESKHSIQLKNQNLDYVIRRSNQRRTIGLTVNHEGLKVATPWFLPLAEVFGFIERSQDWILSKLDKWQSLPQTAQAESSGQDNKTLYYLGNPIQLKIETSTSGQGILLSENVLQIFTSDRNDIQTLVKNWYRSQAYPFFLQRLSILSAPLAKKPTKLSISNAKNLWGSCNSKREIRLNWRLMQASPAVIDYVIAHELAHLRHMNHSASFWAEVATLCPDYMQLRRELRDKDLLYRAI